MNVPTSSDWGSLEDPDVRSIQETFAGRSLEDVRDLLQKNFTMRCIDLISMPPTPFRYYLSAFIEYVQTLDACSNDVAENTACLMDAVEARFAGNSRLIADCLARDTDLLMFIQNLLGKSDLDPELRGELKERIDAIRDKA